MRRDGAITPGAEAAHVPAHFAPTGSWQAKQLHQHHSQFSRGQSCHRHTHKNLASMRAGSLWSCSTLCGPIDYGKGVVGNGIIPFCNLEDSALSRKAPRVGALHTELVNTFHSAELVHHIPQSHRESHKGSSKPLILKGGGPSLIPIHSCI